MKVILLLILAVLMYLYASIPFTYLIGKYIYKVDITKVGSGNVGGTNLGRAVGKSGFILSFIMDASKGMLAVILASLFHISPVFLAVFALLGHAFPIFFAFKGGKGVATACGFVLAYTFWGAVFALLVFVAVLYWKKYVSLASIIAIGAYLIYIISENIIYFYQMDKFSQELNLYFLIIFIAYLFIIYLHRKNIQRIKEGTESKINWM